VAKQRQGRGTLLTRYWVDEQTWYDLEWWYPGGDGPVRVIRGSDGQVCGWGMVSMAWFRKVGWEEWEATIMAFVKKVAAKDMAKRAQPSGEGKVWAETYPALYEYLTSDEYEPGKARITSTLNISLSEGMIKLALNDRDNERTLWVSGASVPDALEALEALLASGGGEWRVNKPWTPPKRQKGK